nr:8kDa-protein [Grapevine leafroll-associated virus 13]
MRLSSVEKECRRSTHTYSAAWCDVEVFFTILIVVLIIVALSLYLWRHSSSTSSPCSQRDSTQLTAHSTYLK